MAEFSAFPAVDGALSDPVVMSVPVPLPTVFDRRFFEPAVALRRLCVDPSEDDPPIPRPPDSTQLDFPAAGDRVIYSRKTAFLTVSAAQ
jgi:hypothetical protein